MTKEYKTEYYYIGVDKARNLIVIKPIGFWPSIDVVPNYIDTIFDVIDNQLDKDFKVIYEVSEMKAHPNEVRDEIHIKGVINILNRKPIATVVVSPESSIAKIQTDFIRKNSSDLATKHVDSLDDALIFMDDFKVD